MTSERKIAPVRSHRETLPPVGRVKGVYGAQNGMSTIHKKKDAYRNAIAIGIGKDNICVCGTPTDKRETGWSNGAPIIQYICPMCGTEHVPMVIEL